MSVPGLSYLPISIRDEMREARKSFTALCTAVVGVLVLLLISWMSYLHLTVQPDTMPKRFSRLNKRHEPPAAPNPIQKDGLRYLPEADLTTITRMSEAFSTSVQASEVTIANNQTKYSLGDDIRVIIRLFDNEGRPKDHGGDYLRIWMTNSNLSAAIGADVIDYNNGTMEGRLTAAWTGSAIIQIQLVRRGEELSLHYTFYKHHYTLYPIHGEFRHGDVSETTECLVKPSGYTRHDTRWCNLIKQNHGFPWHCKIPFNTELSCDTYKGATSSPRSTTVTEIKARVFPWVINASNHFYPIHVTVHSTDNAVESLSPPATTCRLLPARSTWLRMSPGDFFLKDQLTSRSCTDDLARDPESYRTCLKGRTLWLHGDDSSAQLKSRLVLLLQLNQETDSGIVSDPTHNFSISWQAHEMPYHNVENDTETPVNIAQHVIMDALPNATKDIVVLYLYVHFTYYHPKVFEQHVQKLVQSAERLLERAPGVTIAVRGPHAFYEDDVWIGSYWGLVYADVLRKEFSRLQDKVVYLDYWDMTVARGSHGVLPDNTTADAMIHKMMSLLCHRNQS